jgi:pilus assembly protein FimV
MDLPSLDTQPQPLEVSQPTPFIPSDSGLMDFDLGHLSLDLNATDAAGPTTERAPAEAASEVQEDPLATKLALAHEFNAIGDSDGARTLIEEVIAESGGELKARAQRMLSELN